MYYEEVTVLTSFQLVDLPDLSRGTLTELHQPGGRPQSQRIFPTNITKVGESEPIRKPGGKTGGSNGVSVAFQVGWRPGITASSLVIERVDQSHSGTFQCIPSNSDSRSIHVHVLKGWLAPVCYQIRPIRTRFLLKFEAFCLRSHKERF